LTVCFIALKHKLRNNSIERKKWDTSSFYFDGNPIYNIDDDGFKDRIAYLCSRGELNIVMECKADFTMQEQPCHPTNEDDL
jgi:hypothetical protein